MAQPSDPPPATPAGHAGGDYPRVGAFIVDDEDDLRLLLRLEIEARNQGLHVVGEAADGPAALAQVRSADPDVIVLDQTMPEMTGVETARRILLQRPDQPIVLFSAYLDEQVRSEALAAGVLACIPKTELRDLPDLLFELAGVASPRDPDIGD